MEPLGQFGECLALEHHDAGCGFERVLGVGIRMDVAIEIGARQDDNQGVGGALFVKSLNGFEAASGVECDHEIARFPFVLLVDVDSMPQPTEHSRPPDGGDPVAVVKAQGCRGDE